MPEGKLRMRRWAVHALEVHKEDGLQQLKDDPDEMLRGAVPLTAALRCCCLSAALPGHLVCTCDHRIRTENTLHGMKHRSWNDLMDLSDIGHVVRCVLTV